MSFPYPWKWVFKNTQGPSGNNAKRVAFINVDIVFAHIIERIFQMILNIIQAH
jgi:hypothetical protein